MVDFYKAFAPHLAANLVTIMILYGFFRRWSQEREGRKDDEPFLTLGPILLGFSFLGFGLFLYGVGG